MGDYIYEEGDFVMLKGRATVLIPGLILNLDKNKHKFTCLHLFKKGDERSVFLLLLFSF